MLNTGQSENGCVDCFTFIKNSFCFAAKKQKCFRLRPHWAEFFLKNISVQTRFLLFNSCTKNKEKNKEPSSRAE